MKFAQISNTAARVMAWCWHHLIWITSACVLLIAAAVLALRYWVLPNVDNYRETIEQSVSKAAGQRITIGLLSADWTGMHARLNLGDVVVHDKAGRAALTLKRMDGVVSWRSLALWRPRFRSLDVYQPALAVRRDRNGVVSIGGIEMSGDTQEGGFSEWVLNQRDIRIHNAAIDWSDEQRAAPTLQLREVGLHLVNRGERHRFGLKASPPRELAGALDVRGDLSGKSLKNPADWRGRLYVHLGYADLAAWRTWVPLPFDVDRGSGALRAWAVIRDQRLQELTADVQLSDLRTRLGKALPELDLSSLNGRVGWKQAPLSREFSVAQLSLTTAGQLTLQPMDFSYKATTDAKGALLGGEIKAHAVDLAPLLSLAEHLPLQEPTRKLFAELAPQGRLHEVSARWEGALPALGKYSARGRFENLAVNRYGDWPAVQGVNGDVVANEKGGTLQLASAAVKVDLPEVFKETLEFDTVTAQMQWTGDAAANKGVKLKFSNAAFANPDIAGTLQGTFQLVPGQPGIADFGGALTRAQAQRVVRYLPLPAGRGARDWLEAAFLAGTSNDVKFRVKGDLREFPFDDEKKGAFAITATVSGGKLHYGDGWPDIDGIEGTLAFRGKRMEIQARQGAISGARLSGVRAEIPDLEVNRVLTVTGEAEGATADFLKFIVASPVSGYIDHFTDGMQGEGPGKLQLRLELPLRDLNGTRVNGGFQMAANRLLLDASMPPLEQVDGKIEFTESGVSIPSATATFLGGPLTIAGGTQRDSSIHLGLKGRINADALRRAGSAAWTSHLSGAADWNGVVTVRKKNVDLMLDSTLQGIASTLPAPFTKGAGEALPMRLERRFVSSTRDQLLVTLGDIVSARLIRHADGKRTVIDRGMVRLGGGVAAEPERDGVYVSGSLKSLNVDPWLKLGEAPATASGGGSDIAYVLNGVDLKLGEFEVFARKFGDLAISAGAANAGTTHYDLVGREIEGGVDWNPQGRGRLDAKLKRLTIPAAAPVPAAARDKAVKEETQLPALDIVAEQFQMGTKPLGKLELKAVQQQRDWRIEKLNLIHADGTLKADGLWQSWLTNPRTDMNVQWSIVDAGSTLARLGHPNTVREGIAEISGSLSWDGGPHQLDLGSLSGKFAFRAAKGQFMQMEPGLGKLLGVISLQSLPRRLSLDFRDVFRKGFAFDEILGEIKVDRGIASTDKFLIAGPAAKVLMSGAVDLARETQNLQMKVSPHVSEGVAIATGLLGGPIGALAAFVALKLAKDPFDELVALRYTVTGSWADPVVARVDLPSPRASHND